MSRQTSKLIENELYRDKRQRVATENGKNLTIQLRQRKFMLRQGFSAGCQHQEKKFRDKEAPVAINETGRRQKLCCHKGSSITTLIIATWKSLLRQKKSFRERPMSQQGNVCHNTEQRNICRDKKLYVAKLKKEETLVAIDKRGRDM